MEALFFLLLSFIGMACLFCWGAYDDMLEHKVKRHKTRRQIHPDEKPSLFLMVLVWVRLKIIGEPNEESL